MSFARSAIAAMTAGDVAFSGDAVSLFQTAYFTPHFGDDADKLMADGHRGWDGFSGPRIPVVDVDIRSTDSTFGYLYEYIVVADFWKGYLLHPDAPFGLSFDNGFHGIIAFPHQLWVIGKAQKWVAQDELK
jgi:hypothetical protein